MTRWQPNTICKCVFLINEDFKFQEIEFQCEMHADLTPEQSFDSIFAEQKAIAHIQKTIFDLLPDEMKEVTETKKIEIQEGELVQVTSTKEHFKEMPMCVFDEDRNIVMMFTDTHNDLKTDFRVALMQEQVTTELSILDDVPEEKKQEYVDKMSEKIETITIL